MLGYIRKANIQDYVKKAEQRAVQKTTKVFQTRIRRKNDEIRKLKQYVTKVERGFWTYQRKRDEYRNMSADMTERLMEFQKRISRAIGLLQGDIDGVEYRILLDKRDDKEILKLIK